MMCINPLNSLLLPRSRQHKEVVSQHDPHLNTLYGSYQEGGGGYDIEHHVTGRDTQSRVYPRKVFLLGILLIANFLPACIAQKPQPMVSTHASVSIDITHQKSTSHFSPGMSNMDTSLFYPWKENNQAAVQTTKSLASNGLSFINQYIMGWGTDDPWPDPMQSEPNNWSTIDKKMNIVLDTGLTSVITLCEAPWWMKGELQQDGTTKLLTRDDNFAEIAYTSRILDNKMSAWLHLVRRVAERYMVAPYNVRYFQVWNELKGYYNPMINNWDMNTSAGDPSGPYAKHGYTYMYNKVYNTLKDVAVAKGLDPTTVKVGGPYLVMNTWSDVSMESHPSHITKAYGNYDQRDLDALMYWLQHKAGAEFITVDGSNSNHDGINRSDPFTASEKFADVVTWIRSLDSRAYPGAATLPIWWAEWYADANGSSSDAFTTAVKSYAMIKLLKAGGAVVLEWGGTGEGEGKNSRGLWTPTNTADGGQPLPWYSIYKAFKIYFNPGTTIYKTRSSSSDVEALVSPSKAILVNKTPRVLTVTFQNTIVKLNPYQVHILDTTSHQQRPPLLPFLLFPLFLVIVVIGFARKKNRGDIKT